MSAFMEYLRKFGLLTGQMSCPDLVHNGGWYNKKGEKMGWGDLCPKELVAISKGLQGDEMFIVLPEQDSYWTFHRYVAGSYQRNIEAEIRPILEYVVSHASWVITPGKIFVIATKYNRVAKEGALVDMAHWRGGEEFGEHLPTYLTLETLTKMLNLPPIDEERVKAWADSQMGL